MSNDKISKRIEAVLAERNLDYNELLDMQKEMIIEKLSIYHEELLFQNDELHRTNDELEKSTKLYFELFNQTPVPIIVIDINSKIERFNHAASALLMMKSKLSYFTDSIAPVSQDAYYLFLNELVKSNKGMSTEIDLLIGGKTYHVTLFANNFHQDLVHKIRVVVLDQTKQKEYRERIDFLVGHDQLTQIYNRRYYEEYCHTIVEKPFSKVGVVYIDLNNLKLVNDAFGHEEGDKVLILMCKKVNEILDEEDVFCRIGGDEFVIFIHRGTNSKIQNAIQKIRNQTQSMFVRDLEVSASVGSAIRTNEYMDIGNVIKIAEENMYQDKIYASKQGKLKIVGSILAALHGKHTTEEEHSNRVAELMYHFAKVLHYDESDCIRLRTAGLLHDIGKIALNYDIIEAKRPLTDDEFSEIKRHPEIGYKILLSSRTEALISETVLMHHERPDGKGYPRGLTDEHITESGKMLSICDSFDAMISERPYKKVFKIDDAINELYRCSGTQFDSNLVSIFVSNVVPLVYKK